MKPANQEAKHLLRLADRDYQAFEVLKAAPKVALASVGFHAQQAIEKWLKAVLVVLGREVPRTYDLVELAGILSEIRVSVPVDVAELSKLNPFAVALRYDEGIPPQAATREEASAVVEAVRRWAEEIARG